MRQELVRSPRLRHVIDELADEHTDRYTLQTRALAMLQELQATPDRTTVKVLEVVFERFSIVWPPELAGREAARTPET